MFTNSGKPNITKGYKIVIILLLIIMGLEVFGLYNNFTKVTNLSYLYEEDIFRLNKPSETTTEETTLPPPLNLAFFEQHYTMLWYRQLPCGN